LQNEDHYHEAEIYRAEGTYNPVNEGEVQIEPGDIVTLENTFSDGYGEAWNQTKQT
jgi:hypothetical protein